MMNEESNKFKFRKTGVLNQSIKLTAIRQVKTTCDIQNDAAKF